MTTTTPSEIPRLLLALLFSAVPAISQGPSSEATGSEAATPESPAVAEQEDPVRWRLLGSFRGSASPNLRGQVNDLLFEVENDGDLYQDLGSLSLGLSTSFGDFDLDWDNSFYRRVEVQHEELAPGQTLESDDLSRYLDVQSIVTRGRLRYDYRPDFSGDPLRMGAQVEQGASLTVARSRVPLVFAERPLTEVLAERGDDEFQRILAPRPRPKDRSLVRLMTEGFAAVGRSTARQIGRTADTERGTIFYESVADPMTLLIDIGIPIPPELFTSVDDRLSVGDRLRQVTFFGFSPFLAEAREFSFRASYEAFFRVLRETTILKEADDHALVRVRHLRVRGHELIPLKLRPELRLFGVIELGYTFFEKRLDRASTTSSETVYRFDLGNPEGLRSFMDLLKEGTRVSFDPLGQAGRQRPSALILETETRRGHRRLNLLRARLFSPLRYRNKKTVISELFESDGMAVRELVVARSSQLSKRWGQDQRWQKQFLVNSQSIADPNGDAAKGDERQTVALNLISSIRDEKASGTQVRSVARLLQHTIGSHPVLEELGTVFSPLESPQGDTVFSPESPQEDVPSQSATRFFTNVRLSFGPEHLRGFRAIPEEELWIELAALLLGEEDRGAWATATARRHFRKKTRTAWNGALVRKSDLLPNPTFKSDIDLGDRLRLAKRTIRKSRRLRRLIETGDCVSCLAAVFHKWRDVSLMQMLLFRVASRSSHAAPGYHYEVFTDRMLRPVTVTNSVDYDFITGPSGPRRAVADEVHDRLRHAERDWIGVDSFLDSPDGRLRGGSLYLNVDQAGRLADTPEACWKLRLYSDLRFGPELQLRLDLRESGGAGADRALEHTLLPLGAPTAVVETPFMTARYYYDVPLPGTANLIGGRSYTFLLRVLNPDGLSVSEEQQVRFYWPLDPNEEAAPYCHWEPPAEPAS